MRIPNQSAGQMRFMAGTQWQKNAGIHPSQAFILGGFNLRDLLATNVARSLFCNICRIQGCDCTGTSCTNCSLTTTI